MKSALILYHHGLGDVIMLTPLLRELHAQGYETDLMCREPVITSHLLDECPYVRGLIGIENPWWSKLGRGKQMRKNLEQFNELNKAYDWSGKVESHGRGNRIAKNFKITGLPVAEDLQPEVFIPVNVEAEAMNYINKNYPDGYIFNHTKSELHEGHNWDSSDWIANNLPNLPVIDTSDGSGTHRNFHEDINFSFVLAREAEHRVVCSSVFAHACDAMKCTIDALAHGPLYGCKLDFRLANKQNILNIRKGGVWTTQ